MFDQSLFLVYAYTFFLVYTAGKAIYEPTMTYHLSKYQAVSPGVLMGARQSAISLGAIIGPVVAGLIYDDLANWMFVLLSGLLIISSFLLFIYKRSIHL
jgi:predicted MFS family arabinose efflux permease